MSKKKKTTIEMNNRHVLLFLMAVVTGFYVITMLFAYPLYLKNGYYMITDGKYAFFRFIHIIYFGIIGVLLLILLLYDGIKNGWKKTFISDLLFQKKSDYFALAFLLYLPVNSYLAMNQKTAFCGIQDWYMGSLMYACLFMVTFFISRYLHFSKAYLYLLSVTVVIVCSIGYLQRFNHNPITDKGFVLGSSNLTTLGNINWLCGFLAVTVPVLLYVFFQAGRIGVFFWGMCLLPVYGVLAIQGSESGWLIIFSSVILTGFMSFYSGKKLFYIRFFIFISILSVSVYSTGLLLKNAIRLGKTTIYEELNPLLYTKGLLYCAIVSLIICFLIYFLYQEHEDKIKRNMHRKVSLVCLLLLVFICFILGVMILIHYFQPQMFPFMSKYQLLTFGNEWGHDRGGNWILTVAGFRKCGIWRQIFGAGPDCFYYFLKQFSVGISDWGDQFILYSQSVTNAHNEFLTSLINFGLIGFVLFYGFFVCCIKELFTADNQTDSFCVWASAAAVCLFVHNFVSFQQILATPFLFILLGIAKSELRKKHF